jgi:hypothetical protein
MVSVAVAAGASGTPPSCPSTIAAADPEVQRAYTAFRRSVEASPLAWRLGRPVACAAKVEGSAIHLTYTSPVSAMLEAQRDPAIELTEQHYIERGLSQEVAVSLLQRTERWAFGARGCGIGWTQPTETEPGPTPGDRALVYRGRDCNCQGRVLYAGVTVTGVIFRSAC